VVSEFGVEEGRPNGEVRASSTDWTPTDWTPKDWTRPAWLEEFDAEPTARVRPTRVALILGHPRTGSTMLSVALNQTGRFGTIAEYLNYPNATGFHSRWGVPQPTARGYLGRINRRVAQRHLQRDQRRDFYARFTKTSLERYLGVLLEHRTGPNGVFGIKVLTGDDSEAELEPLREGLRGLDVRMVVLRRVDRVAQAVSWARASQTGVYVKSDRPAVENPDYSAEKIEGFLRVIVANETRHRVFAERTESPSLDVSYEELVASWRPVMSAVCTHLGDPDATVGAPPTERQADEESKLWAERFRTERPEVVSQLGYGAK
jgi:LPS sulfotransferase NodH